MPLSTPTIAPIAAEFLADFPEFGPAQVGGPSIFTPSAIDYWLIVAGYTISNSTRWGNLYYVAFELFVAHNLALEAWASQGTPQNQQLVPGIAKGPIAGKSAGDVSITYNNAAVMDPAAQHWNFTVYGIRMWKLIRLIGMGPLQVGPVGCAPSPSGPAWAGPWCFNFPNPSS